MRSIPLAPVVLLIAVVVWLFVCDQSGCEKAGQDMLAFAQDFIHGKRDPAQARQVLGEIGGIFTFSFNRLAKDLHLHLGTMGKPDEDSAVVMIKGDQSEGTGFLVQLPGGPVVITNFHVIASNPNLHVLTNAGEDIKILSIGGASDRDLALLGIQDNGYHYLTLAKDAAKTVQVGDDIVTPGNSEGGEVTLDTPGNVLGIGPDRIEISNPIYHGNSGGPVIDEGSGDVVGVVTFATDQAPTDFIDAASRANTNSAIKSNVRYFALRIDTVTEWDQYDLDAVQRESAFLHQFHEHSLCLDSYLNGAAYAARGVPAALDYYKRSPVLRVLTDPDTFRTATKKSQIDVPEVSFAVQDCRSYAQQDLPAIQNQANFYAFEWTAAQMEIAYRQKLIAQLDLISKQL